MLNLKNVLNTMESTIIMSNGLSTDHKTPRTLRRYFSLKSLETKEVIVNQFRLAFALESGFGMRAYPNIQAKEMLLPVKTNLTAHCIGNLAFLL